MGKLYLVSTPIGNLEDLTFRAKRILVEVDMVACEDTRKTGLLLQHLEIGKKQLISYYEENELKRIPEIIQLLKGGKNIALVSNAGTPTISDPGFKLVRECINEGIEVEAIPGASAILTALIASGLPTDKFLFLGYLSKKEGKRKTSLENLKPISQIENFDHLTIVLYESPYRLIKLLQDIQEVFGDIDIVVCRELTKVHEEIRREKVSQSIEHFEKTPPQGEFTLLFNL